MKKLFSLLIICVIVMVSVSYGSQTEQEPKTRYIPSDDARCAIAALLEPEGLDLNASTFVGTLTVGWFMYDPLLKWNDTSKSPEANIVTEWEVVDDTTINLTIRDDVYSHNGYKIVASDLLYTFERVQDTPLISSYAEAIDLENSQVIDDTHIVAKLKYPNPDQLLYFTQLCMSPTSREGLEACGGPSVNNTNPVACTGPYKFVEWVRGSYMKLERNEEYWGEKPYYKYMDIRFITDSSSRLMALQAGDVGAVAQLTNMQILTVEDDPNLKLYEEPASTYYYVGLNCNVEPLNNVKVRQAINMAVDRDIVLDALFGGHGDTMDNILPVSSSRYSAPTPGTEWEYNVEKARELLKEAGYENGFDLTILTNSQQECIDIAEYLTGALAAIGINAMVEMVETTNIEVRKAAGDFQAFVMTYSAGLKGDTGVFILYDNRQGYADGCYTQYTCSDPERFYDLLDSFYVEVDFDKSKELAAGLMDYLRDEVPVINLISTVELAATRNLDGVEIINGEVDFTHLYPADTQAENMEFTAVEDSAAAAETDSSEGESSETEVPEGEIVVNEDGSITGPVTFPEMGSTVSANMVIDGSSFHVFFDWAEMNVSIDLKGTIEEDGTLIVTEDNTAFGAGSLMIKDIKSQLYDPYIVSLEPTGSDD